MVYGHACCELPAGKRNSLRPQWLVHSLQDGRQSLDTNAGGVPCSDDNFVIVVEAVLLFRHQAAHCVAGSHAGEEPELVAKARSGAERLSTA